jgi:hypothetical protein
MLDCEDRIKSLLAAVFENYKSLDEHSPTGLSDLYGPMSDCAAPALTPAVQIFSILHDILSKEAQDILRNYLQVRHHIHILSIFQLDAIFIHLDVSNYLGVKHDEGIYISAIYDKSFRFHILKPTIICEHSSL